jgi:uncharacterized protein (UPF0218 family)
MVSLNLSPTSTINVVSTYDRRTNRSRCTNIHQHEDVFQKTGYVKNASQKIKFTDNQILNKGRRILQYAYFKNAAMVKFLLIVVEMREKFIVNAAS